MHLSFEKDNTGWYIILPEWKGSRADLAMVAGADTLLDNLSSNSNYITLEVRLDQQDNSFIKLTKIKNCWFNGADYITSNNHKLWLCNVTKFVLGGLPDSIYIKVCA